VNFFVLFFDLLLKKYGTKDYRSLLADAIEVASQGYAVSAWGAGNFRRSRDMLARWPSSAKLFLPGGKPPVVGDWLVQADLIAADTELGLAWARLGRAIGSYEAIIK
jgi:gamma-glutamyltranspeptidase/glutathione hydrolase